MSDREVSKRQPGHHCPPPPYHTQTHKVFRGGQLLKAAKPTTATTQARTQLLADRDA
jgi:hypothetical protein